jgi:hypothetical protein
MNSKGLRRTTQPLFFYREPWLRWISVLARQEESVGADHMVRLRRRSEFADWLRAYIVIIDDEEVGRVRSGREISLPVAPGRHTMHLRIDWCRSNSVEFVLDGSALEFDCGSNFPGLRSLAGVGHLIAPAGEYLWLRQRMIDKREHPAPRIRR